MRRVTLIGTLAIALMGGGLVAAQTAGTKADDHAAHHPEKPGAQKAAPTKGMGSGTMSNCIMMGSSGGMMEGGGMMGMMEMPPGMLGAGAKVEVTKQGKGVTITITSDDAKVVARVQKMAEAMRLMHEARTQ
jgi:hypothetical protein